jgi:excisionase family DNA binding protein
MTHVPHPSPDNDTLSLQEASQLLGVSPSTLRRWADGGKVPAQRTLGGHRRFRREALLAVTATETAPVSVAFAAPTVLVDSRELARQGWHMKLSERPAAEHMRGLGQRLLALLIQHVDSHERESRFLAEARTVGLRYGTEAQRAGISLHDTVQAFLFFRRTCSQWVVPESGVTPPTALAEAVVLHERIDDFMNMVLLGMVAGYEDARVAGWATS